MSRVAKLHKDSSPKSAGAFVITCSTSKYEQLQDNLHPDDESGDIIVRLCSQARHRIEGRKLISDSRQMIRSTVRTALKNCKVDVVIITGGTGVSTTDVTYEAVSPLLDRSLPGLGEKFRRISNDELGSPAMMSRAFAGTIGGKVVFCLPGSPNGVKTAMEKLILSELGHIIGLTRGN